MALTIISTTNRPRSLSAQLPSDITVSEQVDCNAYRGPVASLVAAGIVRADQLPPAGALKIAYFQGQVIKRKCKRDETYLRVDLRDDGSALVLVGVPHDVQADRRAARQEADLAARREAEMRAAMKDPGIEAAKAAMLESPARFNVGEACVTSGGDLAEIVGEYGVYRVRDENGSFFCDDGVRCSYLPGYLLKRPGQQRFFCRAGRLSNEDQSIRHLQLVRSGPR